MADKLKHPSRKNPDVPQEYYQWQENNTEEHRKALLQRLAPTIESGLKSFGTPGLKIRAYILANQALNTFDPTRGASLSTHVYNHMRGLQRYRAEREAAVHIPENMRLNKMHIDRFEKAYHEQHGIYPSTQTIADKLRISKKAVKKAKSTGEVPTILTDKGDSTTLNERSTSDIWSDYVYHDLDDANKKIFNWTTGRGGETLKKGDIAKRLNISPAAVSSRINTISKKLEEGLSDSTGSL